MQQCTAVFVQELKIANITRRSRTRRQQQQPSKGRAAPRSCPQRSRIARARSRPAITITILVRILIKPKDFGEFRRRERESEILQAMRQNVLVQTHESNLFGPLAKRALARHEPSICTRVHVQTELTFCPMKMDECALKMTIVCRGRGSAAAEHYTAEQSQREHRGRSGSSSNRAYNSCSLGQP